MKMKRTTWAETKKKFSGLARMRYDVKEYKTKFGGFLLLEMALLLIYNRKKDCSYLVVAPIGYIDLWGPSDDAETIVLRYDGKVTIEDYEDYNEGGKYREDLRIVCEELFNNYEAKIKERRSSEEED